MTTRTDHRTVTFTRPFTLAGVEGVQPAGAYSVDTDEESIDDLSFLAWRRIATTISIHHDGATQIYRINPADLEASLKRDGGA